MLDKPTSKVTGVPLGETHEQLVYGIDWFILVGDEEEVDEDWLTRERCIKTGTGIITMNTS